MFLCTLQIRASVENTASGSRAKSRRRGETCRDDLSDGFAEWLKQTQGAGSVDDRYTVDEAIRWVEGAAGTPFFLHMNLQSSHVPYVVPKDFPRRFSPAELDFTIMWGRFPQDRVQDVKDRYADSLLYAEMGNVRKGARRRRRGKHRAGKRSRRV